MKSEQISLFLATNSKYFDSTKMMMIKQQLENVSDDKFYALQSISYKDPTLYLIISILGGGLGIDRFMMGQIPLGIIKLITCGAGGVWTVIDWFLIMNMAREYNFQKVMEVLAY